MIFDAANQAALWRLGAFVALLALLLTVEYLLPRRPVPGGWRRRATNVGLAVFSTALLRALFPLGAVGFAANWHSGLLHRFDAPWALATIASLVIFDLAIYWQHRAFHHWALLWRAHRVHHTDTGFDVTLGVRFHPFEILLSFGYKLLVIAVFGMAADAVAIYEISLLAFSLFTHANLALPPRVDRALRRLIVTPDFHRIHHSIHADELNANFGNILSIWDRLFATARTNQRDGQTGMAIGLTEFRDAGDQRFDALLAQPFR